MYQYAPMMSANGNSANVNRRAAAFSVRPQRPAPDWEAAPPPSPPFRGSRFQDPDVRWRSLAKRRYIFRGVRKATEPATMSSRRPAPSSGELTASFNLFSRLAMICSFLPCNRRFACSDEVLFQRLQGFQEMLPVLFGHTSQCFPARDIVVFARSFQPGARDRRKMEKPSAAVRWMRVSFDQPQRLQPTTMRPSVIGSISISSASCLIDALVFREVGQNLPLRSG